MEEENKELTPSYLDQLKQTKKEMEAMNAKFEQNLQKMQELKADEILSGKTEAGKKSEEEAKKIPPQEYSQKALRGEIGK